MASIYPPNEPAQPDDRPPEEPVYQPPEQPVYRPPEEPAYQPPEEPVYRPPEPPAYRAPEQAVYDVTPPKKTMSPWVIVLIVLGALLVLCCICGIAALLWLVPATGRAVETSGVLETLAPLLTGTPMPLP